MWRVERSLGAPPSPRCSSRFSRIVIAWAPYACAKGAAWRSGTTATLSRGPVLAAALDSSSANSRAVALPARVQPLGPQRRQPGVNQLGHGLIGAGPVAVATAEDGILDPG